MTKWYQQKTTWTSIGAILTAISGYFLGTMDAQTAIQTGLIGLISIFMREGIKK